eukprot:Tamp_30435.p1 GENE.Tamp_30435~~Tamp_30435.p1  ORF type:complete len:205 (+),score=33.65 Tamp_30435:50-664(+)
MPRAGAMGSRAKPACSSGVTQWLDADLQWEKLEDTIYGVTRSIDNGVPVHQAIMSAFREEAVASESSRRASFLQGALEYDLMLMMKAPSADRWGFANMLEGPASGAGSCHSGDTSLEDDSEASSRSFSRNAHRDWNFVLATPRVACSEHPAGCCDRDDAAARAPGAGQSPGSCPESTEASQLSSKWKRFKERARRGMRLQWSGT